MWLTVAGKGSISPAERDLRQKEGRAWETSASTAANTHIPVCVREREGQREGNMQG